MESGEKNDEEVGCCSPLRIRDSCVCLLVGFAEFNVFGRSVRERLWR